MGIRSTTWKHSSIHNGGGEPATVRRTGSRWDLRRAAEKHRTVIGPIGRSNRCWPIRSTNASGIYLGTCERRQDQHHPDACQSRRTASQRSSHLARRAVHVRTAGDDHPSAFSQAGPQQFQQQHPALAGPASPARIEAPKTTKRKPGGQNGHEGTTLLPVENPDHVENIAIDRRTIPPGHYTNGGYEARQVIDIVITKFVVEYRAEILQNAQGRQFVAQFPAGVTRPVQYGNGVKSQAVYRSQQQLIPYDRIRDYFWDQCGIQISAGSVFNFNQEAFVLLEPFESFLVRQLVQQPLLHADETGVHINKTLHWLHCLCNEHWTLFFPHAK